MKKIFTLMVAVGLVTLASAQQGNKKDISFNNKNEPGKFGGGNQQPVYENGRTRGFETTSFSTREKEAEIRRINREYDQKIAAVKGNWRMRPQEKSKQIRMLETQRNQEIRTIEFRWEMSNHRNNDRDHNNYPRH